MGLKRVLTALRRPSSSMCSREGMKEGPNTTSCKSQASTTTCPNMHIVPYSVSKKGILHQYFHDIRKTFGSVTYFRFPFVKRKFFVLNTIESTLQFLQHSATDGRLGLFLQDYVLENNGFSFNNYCDRSAKQKEIIKEHLHIIVKHYKTDFYPEIVKTVCAIAHRQQLDIELDVYVKQLLSDIFSKLLIGESLPDDDPEMEALWEFIDSLYRLLPPSIDAPLRAFPWLRHMPIKHGRYFRSAIDARDRVTRRYFDTQKSTYKEGHVRGLVDICLRIQQEALATSGTSWLTDDYIKGLMLDTVVAGMSEMMKSIRMLILLMCHHQDVQSRVYTEIRDVIGPGGTPSTNHREAMIYTQVVIMEMLRYVSQTPLAIPHKCNEDVVLDGYAIEKDAAILPNIWGIHHDEDVWGDPWDFRPERFLAEDGKKLLPADHKFMKTLIPFSVGKRRCPGEDFAMSRLFLVLTSLLQRLHFRPPEGEEFPSVDPRHYNRDYPYPLPLYKCRVEVRMEC
ncbi:steroid 17-alpha-hydroxylase/17,20 lyase-like isoform X2 [Dreissena polymorpha]|uniref:Cytochrome P450 n=1 Tax=Dreissena polymorpha TaxID=45954 RepID=A0A9D4S322_DREPO|nr:steroid 17-alpha-hydroxylase/17,20 lyase-like isoform X2 [Dreissena polymorpha]KAH3888658.1 hypothetical protein DPMN_012698 [Dreissena polymorpha]